jgi:hypothetical protein
MENTRIDPSKVYLVRGKTLQRMQDDIDSLWGGDNIQTGPGILRRGSGDAGFSLASKAKAQSSPSSSGSAPAWPFKVKNTSKGAVGQVQINGGDGFVAQLNSFIFNVNGEPNDTKTGSPAAYPQLSVTGNGVIYGYAVPQTPGTAAPLLSGDVFYAGTVPGGDTASPVTFYPFLIATISNYAVDGSGNVSFDVSNAFNVGPSALIYCGGNIQIY